MTVDEAIRILHNGTTAEALAEIEYYSGFNGREAVLAAVNEACIMACEALKLRLPKKPDVEGDGYADGEIVLDTWICPNCGEYYEIECDKYKYCPNCGQAIDMSEVEE